MVIAAGSGYSTTADAFAAGGEAAAMALDALEGVTPRLLLAFTTEHYDQAAAVRGMANGAAAPLIGCCTGGLITGAGILPSGIAVLALGGDELDVNMAVAPRLSVTPDLSAEQVAERLEPHVCLSAERHSFALMFTDGLTGSLVMDRALQSTAAILGPLCPIFGGAAGDSLNFGHTTLFADGQVLNDALAIALLNTGAPVGFGVRHGWKAAGRRLVITASEGNVIHEFEGRPAIEVYRQMLPGVTISPENFRAVSLFHPIGFPQLGGEYLVRLPLAITATGGIECLGVLPSNSIAHIMQGDPDSLIDAATVAAERAVAALNGCQPAAAIVIDCVTRPPLLGATPLVGGRSADEIEAIRAVVGRETPLIGMYSFGELAADEGPPCYHNKTVAVCVIGRPA